MPTKNARSRSATEFIGVSAALSRNFQDNLHRFRYGIIAAQLDLAVTFCKLGISAIDREGWDERLVSATNAYDAARVLLEETNLTIPENAAIQDQLRQVHEIMERATRRTHFVEAEANGRHSCPPPRSYF